MKIAGDALTATTWVKSHRMVLLPILLIVFVIIIDWYYVNATQPTSRATSENLQQAAPSIPASTRNDSSTSSTNVQSIIQNDDTSASSPIKTSVNINGRQVPVPQTGTTHKVIQDDNGTTTVDISVDNNSAGSTSNNSSTNIQFNSTSEIDSDIESSTQ